MDTQTISKSFEGVTFDHTLEYVNDDITFAAARTSTGRSRLYLIYNHTGHVYHRNGRLNRWDLVEQGENTLIRSLAAQPGVARFRTSQHPEFTLR